MKFLPVFVTVAVLAVSIQALPQFSLGGGSRGGLSGGLGGVFGGRLGGVGPGAPPPPPPQDGSAPAPPTPEQLAEAKSDIEAAINSLKEKFPAFAQRLSQFQSRIESGRLDNPILAAISRLRSQGGNGGAVSTTAVPPQDPIPGDEEPEVSTQAGSEAAVTEAGSAPEVTSQATGSEAEVPSEAGSEAEVPSGSEAEVPSGSEAEVPSGSEAEVPSGSEVPEAEGSSGAEGANDAAAQLRASIERGLELLREIGRRGQGFAGFQGLRDAFRQFGLGGSGRGGVGAGVSTVAPSVGAEA